MSRQSDPGLPLPNGSPHPLYNASSSRPRTPIPMGTTPQTTTSTFAKLSPSEAATRLSTSLTHGLSPNEANIRLGSYGPNELPHDEPEPLWLRFLKQFRETLILLLLGSALVSFIMGNLEDALSISVAVTIVVTVGFVQEYRSEKSLEALNKLVPHYAHLIRVGSTPNPRAESATADQSSNIVSANTLVPGDLISFFTGDRIPADVRITHGTDLSIDESNLTGENEPVHKTSDTLTSHGDSAPVEAASYASDATGIVGADLRLGEQTNIGFMGTLVRSGYGHGIVIGTGGNTEFGAVSRSLGEIESPRTPLQMSMDRLGKELSYMSFGVIGVIMLVGLWRGWEFLEMFQTGVSLAVAAIPEGLPIIVTVTLALGVFRMSKRNAIVKRLPSVETLGSVNVICSDKTGTLTTNHMTVTKLWHFDAQKHLDATDLQKSQTLDAATTTLVRIGNIANNARLAAHANGQPATAASSAIWASTSGDDSSAEQSRWLGQPTDVAMLDLVDLLGDHDVREGIGERRHETPFSSDRKWMGVIIRGSGDSSDVAYMKGAIERVLSKCDTYITKDGRDIVLDEAGRTRILQAAESMANEGLRVLGMAKGATPLTKGKSGLSRSSSTQAGLNTAAGQADDSHFQGLAFSGLVGMSDPPRKGVDRAIRRLMAGGVKVIMITGDAESTAVAIGKKLGMPINTNTAIGRPVIRGDELDKMSEEELSQAIVTTTVFARTSPEHKLKIVRALQRRGDIVAMTGDGVNDAPALKKADIGVAMGRLGTDVAKEAADMILTDDDFSTILNAIEEGKGIFSNIQNFITFQLSTSAAALSLVFFSTFLGFPNPLNAMQILWINILMDGPPAQSLGVEPVDPAVMSRPPRSKNARVLTRALLQRVVQSGAVIMIGTMLTYIHEMSDGRVVSKRDTTMTFTCFVLFDMFNALSCRSESKSVLTGEIKLFSNHMFNWAVGLSLIGQAMVIYLPLLQNIFQTEALGIFDLIRLGMVASTVFWADEARKYIKRRGIPRGLSGYSASV